MEALEAISARRSVRDHSDARVEPGIVGKLLEASILAPGSTNLQPWAFAVLTNRGRIEGCTGWLDLPRD